MKNSKVFTDRSCASMRPRHSGILLITGYTEERRGKANQKIWDLESKVSFASSAVKEFIGSKV